MLFKCASYQENIPVIDTNVLGIEKITPGVRGRKKDTSLFGSIHHQQQRTAKRNKLKYKCVFTSCWNYGWSKHWLFSMLWIKIRSEK